MVEWRNSEYAEQKMAEDLSVIEDKQQRHLQEYRKQREELSHLNWRRRKLETYRSYRDKLTTDLLSEGMQGGRPQLPLVIKGTNSRTTTMLRLCGPNVLASVSRSHSDL